MRKFDCNSFRITTNTNFKKKLTSFVSKYLGKSSYESQSCIPEIRRQTAGAEVVVFRPFSERLLWMDTEEQNNSHRSYFLKKNYLKTQMFLYSNEIRLFQRNVPVLIINSTKIFNRCDENFTTKLSRIWACFLKYLLEFSISLTKKSITQC